MHRRESTVSSRSAVGDGFHDRVLDGIRKFLEAHAMQGQDGAREFYEFERTLHERLLEGFWTQRAAQGHLGS